MGYRVILAGALLTLVVGLVPRGARAGEPDDRFLAGYAAAVLERELHLTAATLRVRDGVISIGAADLGGSDRDRVVQTLSALPGVVRVEVVDEVPEDGAPAVEARVSRSGGAFLPPRQLFEPLLADPRWPHFSASYQRYQDDDELKNVGAANFGISFGLYEDDFPLGGRWQVGLQTGVFAVFDLDAESSDLINADYFVALPLSHRVGSLSSQLRVFHQSSHLGDEFLLRNTVNRVNLSYEGVDGRLSLAVVDGVRVYGGGGALVRVEPSDIERFSSQAGLELESPWSLFDGLLRPIAGVDVQNREEADWETDLSIRGGVQLENRSILSHEIQILAEYFEGRSPNGQFYERDIEYFGLGVHLQLD